MSRSPSRSPSRSRSRSRSRSPFRDTTKSIKIHASVGLQVDPRTGRVLVPYAPLNNNYLSRVKQYIVRSSDGKEMGEKGTLNIIQSQLHSRRQHHLTRNELMYLVSEFPNTKSNSEIKNSSRKLSAANQNRLYTGIMLYDPNSLPISRDMRSKLLRYFRSARPRISNNPISNDA
jgi:hypothetical protein